MKTPFAFLFIAVLCFFHTAAAQGIKEAEALYKKGDSLYKENQYQAGIDEFEKAWQIFKQLNDLPGQVKTQNLKGECLANLGKCDKAIELLQYSLSQATANLEKDHPEVINSYYYLSRAYGGCARKLDEAIRLMRQSMALKKERYGSESLEITLDYNFMGYYFRNNEQPDSALPYLNKALAIRRKKLPPGDIEISHTLYFLARVYESQGELDKALELHQEAFTIRQARFKEANATISNSLEAIGNVYQKFGNYDRALDYYQRTLQIRKKVLGEAHSNVGNCYYNIGNLYNSMFNYHSAIQYYQQGNSVTENALGVQGDILSPYYAAVGKAYGMVGEHALALEHLKKARAHAEKNLPKDHAYRGIVYASTGDYYAGLNDVPEMTGYFKKAIGIFHKAYGLGSVREADALFTMAGANAKNKRFSDAITLYSEALAIYESKMGKQNPKTAAVHHAIGDAFRDQNKFRTAMISYRRAFACISAGRNDSTSLYTNPAPDELESKSLALRIAGSKALALFEKAKFEKNELPELKQSLSTCRFAMQLIDHIAAGYNNENAKVELEKDSRKIYAMAIDVAYRLYELTKHQLFLEEAFDISGKSKSVLLLENIRDSQAKTLAGVPDSLVATENDIKVELGYYKNKIYQARKEKTPEKIQMYEKNVFEIQQKYDRLKHRLEHEFPVYYHFKYKTHTANIADIRKLIKDGNVTVVEFFVSDTSVYIFTLTPNAVQLERKKRDGIFDGLLRDYEKSLTNTDFILSFRKEADQLYIRSARLLYKVLLESAVEKPDVSIQKLIIIPDDVLSQFNFGTLLTKDPPSETPDYKTLDYLIKRCEVSYAYSTAFIKNEPVRLKHVKNFFAGFAPSYSGDQFSDMDTALHPMVHLVMRNGNLPLPGAEAEVRSISSFMGGKSWLKQEATETNFKQHAGDYGILHLAMHSLLNSEDPEYSELLFNHETDPLNDGFLKVSEIYNLTLNADLVVLSACSSGYGKIQKGEGPISISRAFSYAGCPSVVMSHWKVPDDATRQIMIFFYEELLDARQKDEALRHAQLKFLNETDDPLYHHPYFWAGFVLMGDTSAIASSPVPVWIFVGIMMVASAVSFVILRKKRKSV